MKLLQANAALAGLPAAGQSVDQLKALARDADPKALEAAAQQFEAVFTRMMLKSMREASFGDPLFGGNSMEFYRDMHDQELAKSLSGSIGLAEIMVRQMRAGQAADGVEGVEASHALDRSRVQGLQQRDFRPNSPAAFIEQVRPHAQAAADKLGVDADALIAQAALETGWGQHVLRDSHGRNSFNLFNIKAHGWDGPRVQTRTLEYVSGQPRTEQASFRSYDSLSHAFEDYANFIRDNPRYQQALNRAGEGANAYLQELQRAGYATDPHYAEKIGAVLARSEFTNRDPAADDAGVGVL